MDENPPSNALQSQTVPTGVDLPPPPPPPLPSDSPCAKPPSYWLKKFLACNPFYLVSAALLLYGFYLVSSDANFPGREAYQLGFNFGSLQFYEVLLVATAIFLARRRIWYDSVLLTGLENLLVLVPFILISQAALLNQRTVWIICLAAGVAAAFRFWGLKRFFTELNLPRRMLGCGLVLLLVNVALPLIYRHLHETKFGTKPTEGAAFEMDRYSWLVLLPAMFALINLLPRPKQTGNLLPQLPWLPMGLFVLWLSGSAVHLYCLSYVYNFDWQFLFAVPLLWVVLWAVHQRHSDFLSRPIPLLSRMLLLPPVLITFLVMTRAGNAVFLVLTALNIALFTTLFVKDRDNRTAFHLMLVSLVLLPAGLSRTFEPRLPTEFHAEKWVVLAATGYLLYWVIRSRNAKLGLAGAWIIGIAVLLLAKNMEIGAPLAAQLALAFLLMHSLRWEEQGNHGAGALRFVAGAVWVLHALFLVHSHWFYMLPVVYGTGGLLLAVSAFNKFFSGSWKPIAVPIAASLVLLAQPGDLLAGKLQSAPGGLLALMGSFFLFGIGTLAALTKSKWNAPTPVTVTVTTTETNQPH